MDVDGIEYFFGHFAIVAVESSHDQCEVAVIVEQEDHQAHFPVIGEIAECDEEDGEAVMKGVLKEISLGADEDVAEEPAEVFAELKQIEYLHFEDGVGQRDSADEGGGLVAAAAHPAWQIDCFCEDAVCPNRRKEIVDYGVAPLHQGVTALLAVFLSRVFLPVDVVLLAEPVEDLMHSPIKSLCYNSLTVKTAAKGRLNTRKS